MSAVTWRRVWPRRSGDPAAGLVLEGNASGRVVAGTAAGPGAPVRVRPHDPRLPDPAPFGGELIAHRFGKRAVLRRPDGFVKLASARATAIALARHAELRRALRDVPGAPDLVEVLGAAPGVLHLRAATGPDFTTVLTSGAAQANRVAGERAAQAAAALAAACAPGLPVHDLTAEVATLHRWVGDATAFGVAPPALAAAARDAVRAVQHLPPRPLVPAHRDLHDGQVLLGERVTLLDVDTAALADPALDVANLLAHLDLAAARGQRTAAAAAEAGVWAGTADAGAGADPARVAVLRRLARCRVVAVHAFRGLAPAAAAELLA
ncbi:hypothetical protein [Kineococcus sp. SYSU DK001]|uniref:hypothetical protein n=1 Tax=Kineococcus sp. SYSU DK001 TaxID=3383122 RepID=UPI003D7DED3A